MFIFSKEDFVISIPFSTSLLLTFTTGLFIFTLSFSCLKVIGILIIFLFIIVNISTWNSFSSESNSKKYSPFLKQKVNFLYLNPKPSVIFAFDALINFENLKEPSFNVKKT